MKSIVIRLAIAAICISYAGISGADDAEDNQVRIEELRDELSLKRSRHEELSGKEKDQIEKLRSLEEQIALSGQLLLKIRKESNKLEKRIASNKGNLEDSRSRLAGKKQLLAERLRYIYKHGSRPEWLELLSSDNPTEAIGAVKNINRIMEFDKNLVESLMSLSRNIELTISNLENENRRFSLLEEYYKSEVELRTNAVAARRQLLSRIRNDKAEIEGEISILEEDAAAVAGIFDQLDTGEKAEGPVYLPGLEKSKGDLIWPIQGRIVKSFGSREDQRGIRLTNPGIDIKAVAGSKVKAAAAGTAIYISWLRGYGQFVILDHGMGYYTLYANLTDVYIDTGDQVKGGEIIAELGKYGLTEDARLHFELRLKKEPLDPLKWLR